MESELFSYLQNLLQRPIVIQYNNNRSVFLSMKAKGFFKSRVHISLHKAFLLAPMQVIEALGKYIKKKDISSLHVMHQYMDQYFADKPKKLHLPTKGREYDLQTIYEELNKKYFENRLDIQLGWATKPKYRRLVHITFGSYDRINNSIRINNLLDHCFFPPFFVSYILYHEMLHSIFPILYPNGKRRVVHSMEFREREKLFSQYSQAKVFEKDLINNLKKRKDIIHGRP